MGKFLEMVTTESGWEYVTRVNCAGAVIVLVYHKDKDRYLMVEQYRPPVGCRVLEWPAGLVDEGETPLEAVKRELYEETGVRVDSADLMYLGRMYTGVGITDEEVDIFAVEIDDSFRIGKPDICGCEVEHKLVRKWVTEKELMLTKAAKALSVYVRYKVKKSDPDTVFPV